MKTTGSSVPNDQLLARLQSELGESRIRLLDGGEFRVGSEESRIVALPESIEELSTLLRLATADRLRVIPAGAGTWLGMGKPAGGFDLVVSTAGMSRIIDYEPADLTATVEAGCQLAAFNLKAAADRQFIPLDPFGDERSTIGAVISTASFGPLRCAYGTPRDWLIGIRVVHADGRITSAGGKVVKNVAGYDLCKLYTGSFGTLGIIAEMSFKLRSLPSDESTIIINHASAEPLLKLTAGIMDSDLSPSAMELISPGLPHPLVEAGRYSFALRFLNEPETVAWQREEAVRMAGDSDVRQLSSDESLRFWKSYRDDEISDDWRTCIRVSSLPTALADTISDIRELLGDVQFRAHAANGVVRLFGGEMDADAVDRLRKRAAARGGALVVLKADDDFKRRLDVWGDPGPGGSIMRQIKERFDPQGLLNPGRFLVG